MNNVQRKMLDNLYCQRFDVRTRQLLSDRADEFSELHKTLVSTVVASDTSLVRLKNALAEVNVAFNEARDSLEDNKLVVSSTLGKEQIKFRHSYGGEPHPELTAFNRQTEAIKEAIAGKRMEMRAKIYGLDVNYAEVVAEVEALLEEVFHG